MRWLIRVVRDGLAKSGLRLASIGRYVGRVRVAALAAVLAGSATLAMPQAALAQTSLTCSDLNAGLFNFDPVPPGSVAQRTEIIVLAAGDAVTVSWGGLTAFVWTVNGTPVSGAKGTAGSASYTAVTDGAVPFHKEVTGGPGFVRFTCTPASTPPTPTPPSPPPSSSGAQAFLTQNRGAATAALAGDAGFVAGLPAATPDECRALRWRLTLLGFELDSVQSQIDDEVAADTRTLGIFAGIFGASEETLTPGSLLAERDRLGQEINRLEDLLDERCGGLGPNRYVAERHDVSGPLSAFDVLLGDVGATQDGISFFTPLGYAGDRASGLPGDPGFTFGEWSLWSSARLSGLGDATGGTFGSLTGRVDLGASTRLANGMSVGGFLGWDGTHLEDASSGGTVSTNALHFGAFGQYQLTTDLALAVSGGGAFGALTSEIGGDGGTTGTRRGFVSASLSGTIWQEGPWRITPTGTLFVGAEQQDAFTTSGGTAVPAQLVTLASGRLDTVIGYTLPTEVPVEIFGSAGIAANGGNSAATGVSGALGAGVNLTQDQMQARLSASVGIGALRSWTVSGFVGGRF